MEIESLEQLVEKCNAGFEKEFGSPPTIAAKAPGRVNIIGEHTDYNDGFVFPMAVPMYTVVVGKPNGTDTIRLATLADSVDEPKRTEFSIPKEGARLTPGTPKWANYVKGVVEYFPAPLVGFDACFITSVPIGAGLSSSASLEVSTCTFLEILTKNSLELTNKAKLCQKAEHNFAHMPCGIMDQFISCMGKDNNALLIDCRSLEAVLVPLVPENAGQNSNTEDVTFLVVNSNVKHELTGSEYPQRRNDCIEASKILGVKSLREADMSSLREKRDIMGDRVYRRSLHVVSEIERCTKASEAILNGNLEELGRLMYQSHVSMRDLYEISCPELDQLVDITMQTSGVYGSRMTGGGFGGCIVALVKSSEVNKVIEEVNKRYTKGSCYVFKAVGGAEEILL